ncbi:piwi-like protein Siwi [Neocloeon triangulifer]|uniref:piwi-like protein Siwi n=1 Tax=Neocloeon triangulifer TaxID=2078957 RepID=UPI00286FAB1B|nr:piwi-like protein Siwi [Neocloeon triangulifer]XP_059471971.1 piwi-like protein Siwi [Neocloeon triangulifer]XP_059471972.1 piwi-like protein Siwi [Neocloeon triangulifer]
MEPTRRPIGRARGRSTRDMSSASSDISSVGGLSSLEAPPNMPATSFGRVPGAPSMAPPPRPRSPSSLSTVSSLATSSSFRPSSARGSEMSVLRTRPEAITSKKGSTGQPINLMANYFKLCKVTNCTLYQYHVDFTPEEDRPKVRKALLRKHAEELGGHLFDGMILYSARQYKNEPYQLRSTNDDGCELIITIKLTRMVEKGHQEYIQFFNVLMRRCLQLLNLQLVGRNFFDPHAKVVMGNHGMELWPGYQTSIREHEQDILMCTRITHKVMRTDTVLDLMVETQKKGGDWQKNFCDSALGLVVLTDYNNKTYRIDDVDFKVSPRCKFSLREKGEISYAEYYTQRYGINIRVLDQPLLITKSKAKEIRAGMSETVFLIPELCRITGLTDQMRSNYRLMSALAEHTRVGPSKRVEKMIQFARRLMGEDKIVKELSDWNMQIEDSLVQFEGRVLPQENIIQGREGRELRYPAGPTVDWTKQLKRTEMREAPHLTNWVVMVPRNIERETCNFVNAVIDAARQMGFQMDIPKRWDMNDDHQSTYVNELEEMLSQCVPKPSLVLCAVSNNRGDRYSAIKKKTLVDRPVPTQVVTVKAMTNKNLQSIACKVAIQINCKVGGAPWAVEMPMRGTMFVGFDVSHDTMNKSISYGCIVASLNNSLSRWYSVVSAHKSSEEMSNEVSVNLVKALRKYQEVNDGHLPSRIIIYRDGVGDGQIPYVCKHEISLIKERLTEMYRGDTWRMGFIIVSKRINTRLFSCTRPGAPPTNPPAGTVVDDCITLPERYDFYVVSQHVNEGTVSPTSYHVISDNTGLDPDKMQRLAYKMTYVYFNWSGTVKVPGPVQYAHKLAAVTAMYLHRLPSPEIADLLYFL